LVTRSQRGPAGPLWDLVTNDISAADVQTLTHFRDTRGGTALREQSAVNQVAETRPWEGRVVDTEGGPEGRALLEQASTKQAR
jgi:hypothetical protein